MQNLQQNSGKQNPTTYLKNHFMANRWENNGNSDRLNFLGSKITSDGDCGHEIKTLAPWKKWTNS